MQGICPYETDVLLPTTSLLNLCRLPTYSRSSPQSPHLQFPTVWPMHAQCLLPGTTGLQRWMCFLLCSSPVLLSASMFSSNLYKSSHFLSQGVAEAFLHCSTFRMLRPLVGPLAVDLCRPLGIKIFERFLTFFKSFSIRCLTCPRLDRIYQR